MRAVEGAFGLRTKRIQAKLGEQGGALAAYRDAVDCAVGVLDGEAKFQLWRLRSVGDAEGAAALEHLLQWQRRRSSKLMEALEMDPTTHRSCDVVGVTAESGYDQPTMGPGSCLLMPENQRVRRSPKHYTLTLDPKP